MDENAAITEENSVTLYPMFFGVSCAFFALKLLPEPEICDEKWSEIRNRMLKGSAHLLGLVLWIGQKKIVSSENSELQQNLENAHREIERLKKLRNEDAKANEKVVSIFAAREQSWFEERKKLRQQIGALMNDLRVLESKRDESVSELDEKLKETEVVLQLKGKLIEESEQKRFEAEAKLKAAEDLTEELRENVKSETLRHCSEISKHKTAFIELVSNQRQLEAEIGRTMRQVEAAKQEIDSILEQKEELIFVNQRLSMEIVKIHKDLEQKDQILSAMLRKSRFDTAEKQMLLNEVKSSKAKRKQAEMETARWKAVSESKNERYSVRNMFSKHVRANSDAKLENWGNSEVERYEIDNIAIEQRHQVEIDAFLEQLRQKDDKLESYNWRLMSMELELQRLQSHIEALDHEIIQLRRDNMKMEAILLDREAELGSLKEQLITHFSPPNPVKLCSPNDAVMSHDTAWSRVKIIKRKPGQRRQGTKAIADEKDETLAKEQLQDIVLTIESPKKETRDRKVDHFQHSKDVSNAETSKLLGEKCLSRISDSTWKMDIHALGVSYKVKRLKQQLFMLERLTGKKEICENNKGVKGFYSLISLLNKQVDRYQSLQSKIDDLSTRMHEKNLNLKSGGSKTGRPEEETKTMEQFLDETFQLQRYIVATGQKLIEVQAKIASSFVAADAQDIDKPASFDIERFADGIKTLFREVQRGLEVRISRIIGDLEGTLACDGFRTL